MNWEEFRDERLRKYRRSEIDEWIKPLTDLINSCFDFVTLSSCAGRIAVIDLPEFGDKKNAVFLGKWHEFPKVSDVVEAIKRGRMETWLMMNPPILHVACRNIERTSDLLRLCKTSGFRRAGIISLKNFVVEISAQERVELLAARNGSVIVDEITVHENLTESIEKLERSRKRFEKLYRGFKELFLSL